MSKLRPQSQDFCETQGSSELSPADGLVHRIISRSNAFSKLTVRQIGLIKLLIGIPIAIAWYVFQLKVEQISDWLRLLIPGFPGVLALIGITELTTGIPITELSKRWDSLKGWQRGILGITLVIAIFILIFGILYLILREHR